MKSSCLLTRCTVCLEVFRGPLDELVALVHKKNLAVTAVKVKYVVEQIRKFFSDLEQADMESAGDSLVAAAALIQMKTRSLVPRSPETGAFEETAAASEEAGDEGNPGLQSAISNYLIYKEKAVVLGALEDMCSRRVTVPSSRWREVGADCTPHLPLQPVLPIVLAECYQDILARVQNRSRVIQNKRVPFFRSVGMILRGIRSCARQGMGFFRFSSVVASYFRKAEIVGAFLAILELSRRGRIHTVQRLPFDDILIYSRSKRSLRR